MSGDSGCSAIPSCAVASGVFTSSCSVTGRASKGLPIDVDLDHSTAQRSKLRSRQVMHELALAVLSQHHSVGSDLGLAQRLPDSPVVEESRDSDTLVNNDTTSYPTAARERRRNREREAKAAGTT